MSARHRAGRLFAFAIAFGAQGCLANPFDPHLGSSGGTSGGLPGGGPKPEDVTADNAHELAQHGSDIVFAKDAISGAFISRVAKTGGTVVDLAPSQEVAGMVVDGDDAYWSENPYVGSNAGVVKKVPVAGGAVATLAQSTHRVKGIAVDDQYAYWLEPVNDGPDQVMRVPKGGGAAESVAATENIGTFIQVDAAALYWTEDSRLVKLVKGSGSAMPLAEGNIDPFRLVLDDAHVYWTDIHSATKIVRLDKAGGQPDVLVQSMHGTGFAVDASNVYFTGSDASFEGVLKAPLSGGAASHVIDAGQFGDDAEAVTVDDEYVYWTLDKFGISRAKK